jgi:hypothetical protein
MRPAHRLEQGERAIVRGHRLISDAGGTRLHQAFSLRLVRREVEIGEQQVAAFQQRDFARLRLLHFHDHVALREHAGGIREDRRAGRDIVRVLEVDPEASTGLNRDGMASGNQFGDRRGRQADAIFVVLDFLGDANAHVTLRFGLAQNTPVWAECACKVAHQHPRFQDDIVQYGQKAQSACRWTVSVARSSRSSAWTRG